MDDPLARFWLYRTIARCYLVGSDKSAENWRILKFNLQGEVGEHAELDVIEDAATYSKAECASLLKRINDGNIQHGGLQLVCQAYGVIGCFKFLEGYYLLLVTKKRFVGALCGHKVYGIEATALVPLVASSTHKAFARNKEAAAAEQRYRRLLAGVSLNNEFYFSYGLPLWRSVQRGLGPEAAAEGEPTFASDRVWNEYLTRPLREALGQDRWVLPLVHGFWQQRRLALFGRTLTLTLIARRSRQFAGTRYRKRGVSDAGYCANDVETEQVLEAGCDWRTGQPLISSMVQVRGSIPLYWAQASEVGRLKPEITLQRFDPLYAATRKHFEDLRRRYGSPLAVLNLVKLVERHPREGLLGREFAAAVAHLNRQAPPAERIQYVDFDLSRHAKADSRHLLSDLQRLQAPLLRATGVFVSGASGGGGGSEQHGVLRTNCVDCLDRTNVAQFTFGLLALGRQLHTLGISEGPGLDPDSSLARQLMDAYESMGHSLSQQYGGSEAHTAFFQRQRGDWEAATQSRDVLTAIRRYYSNAITDAEKQDSLNIFLGNFVPRPGTPHVWELGSDYYLHSGRGVAGLARHLFLGGPSGAPAAPGRHGGPGGHAPPSPGAGVPPSRESSFHSGVLSAQGPLAGRGAGGKGGTEMVSLSDSMAPGAAVAATAAHAAAPGGAGPGMEIPARRGGLSVVVPESASGSESGRLTPSPPPGALGIGSPRLTVSTDGVEVPTLSQLVEGASPTWRPSVAVEASMEPLPLEEPLSSSLATLSLHGSIGSPRALAAAAAAAGEVLSPRASAGWPAGAAAEAAPGAAAAEGTGQAQQQQEEEAAAAGEGDVPELAAGTGAPPAEQLPPTSPDLSPPVTPTASAAAAATGPAPSVLKGAAPAQEQPRRAQGGPPAVRRPPPSPRRNKLESFDKLISKPPNAIKQVRLTPAPVAPPKSTSLTSWLASPGRSKPPQSPPPLPRPQPQRQAASSAAGMGAGKPPVPAFPALGPQPQQAAGLGYSGLGLDLPFGGVPPSAAPRLFRSSSDNTLLTSFSEGSEARPLAVGAASPPAARGPSIAGGAGAPAALSTTGSASAGAGTRLPRQVSLDFGHSGAAAAAAMPLGAGGLSQSTSASAADLTQFAARAGGAGGAGAYKAPLIAPPGYLVVLDAWDAWSAPPPGALASASAAAAPAPPPPPPPPPAPRRSRFPGFSLRGFGRSKSSTGLSTPPDEASGAHPAPVVAPAAPPPAPDAGLNSLGLPARTAAAWWVGGADPVALMLAEEARLREQYTRQLQALSTPPSPADQRALEQQYAALTRPTWSLTLSGELDQGAALQWRQQAGLMGAPSLGQEQLASLAQHHAAQAAAQQAEHGLAY